MCVCVWVCCAWNMRNAYALTDDKNHIDFENDGDSCIQVAYVAVVSHSTSRYTFGIKVSPLQAIPQTN